MGLCKCPKKKVTNLFCFEHRVNVCEHCLVSNHPRCIVQSYLQWLQDSDFDPNCSLCNKPLVVEEFGDCVRLVCYDVFHWTCLNTYCRQMPGYTAPAGFTCPTCNYCIFPPSNLSSPVAEALLKYLNQVNWARAGLGLPLIDEPYTPSDEPAPGGPTASPPSIPHDNVVKQTTTELQTATYTPTSSHMASQQTQQHQSHQAVVGIDDTTPYVRTADKPAFDPRKMFDSTSHSDVLNTSRDHDEDKYARRPALQWFARWFSNRSSSGYKKKDPNATMKRFIIVVILGIIGFLTIVVVFTRMGRASAANDPFLDPMANPNIRVGNE